MKTLLLHVHDLTILISHQIDDRNRLGAIVQRSAERALQDDPEMAPAAFLATLISELVTEPRFDAVHVMARFEPRATGPAEIMEINFETGRLTRNFLFPDGPQN